MSKSNVNFKLALIVLGILIIGIIYFIGRELFSTQRGIANLSRGETDISENLLEGIRQGRVLYLIDKGNRNADSYQVTPSQNSTVFSLLEILARRENFKIESTIYQGMGVFVESIDGIKNGVDNKYWQYWVNGDLPTVAADKKEVKGGDKIEWKFAPSPF